MPCDSFTPAVASPATANPAMVVPFDGVSPPAGAPAPMVKITESQANALRALRALKTADKKGYKDARSALFANIREQLGIPSDVVTSIEIDDRSSALYCVVKARPPKSKSAVYVPLIAGADGKYVGAAPAAAVQWASLPLRDVVALLQEQAETMEGYVAVGTLPAQVDASWIRIPPAGDDDGVEMYVTPDERVIFRQPGV